MRKLFFTASALALLAGNAMAEGPKVTIGGFFDVQVGLSDLDESGQVGNFTDPVHSKTDTELHFNIDGETDSGLKYGAHIELEADVNADDDNADISTTNSDNENVEQAFIYLETAYGRVQAGPHGDAGNALRVDVTDFASGSGGIGGQFYKFGVNSAANSDLFYILPGLPTASFPGEAAGTGGTNRATANKISYYSPKIHGAQIGISFTPDQQERGTNIGFSNDQDGVGSFRNTVNAALSYEREVNGLGINASVNGDWGKAETDDVNDDLKAYAVGLTLSYAGASIGGSYANIDEFGQTTTQNREAQYFTLGAGYAFGPASASVTYLQSEVENGDSGAAADAEFQNIVLGADYKLAPGLVPYVEISFFETDDNVTGDDNEGTIFIAGTTLSF